jgi:hypothetical protein
MTITVTSPPKHANVSIASAPATITHHRDWRG